MGLLHPPGGSTGPWQEILCEAENDGEFNDRVVKHHK